MTSIEIETRQGPARSETAWLLAAIALGQVAYAWSGVRFDASSLDWYWQYLDPPLLRTDLWRSVLHLHGQPPFFNLYLGAVLHVPARLQGAAFALSFLAFGIGSAWALLALQARLGVRRAVRLPISILFAVSPEMALYENLLFYALPVAALLVASAWLLAEGPPSRCRWAVAFWLLAAVALTHALFHLLWLVGALVVALALAPVPRRRFVLALGLPLMIVVGWYARSLWLFDTFSASSWLGMNLAHRVQLAPGGRELVEAMAGDRPEVGILRVRAFSPLADYGEWVPAQAPSGIAALDQPLKSSGAPNLEHRAYVAIARRSARAALAVFRGDPAVYWGATGMALRAFVRPAADSPWLGRNARRIEGWIAAWGRVVEGRWRPEPGRLGLAQLSLVWILVLPLAVTAGVRMILRGRRGREPTGAMVAAGVLVWTIVYVVAVGNGVELGENDRFRFLLEPLLLALLGRWLSDRLAQPRAL